MVTQFVIIRPSWVKKNENSRFSADAIIYFCFFKKNTSLPKQVNFRLKRDVSWSWCFAYDDNYIDLGGVLLLFWIPNSSQNIALLDHKQKFIFCQISLSMVAASIIKITASFPTAQKNVSDRKKDQVLT